VRLETWIASYLDAFGVKLAPKLLAGLIASERKYVAWLARLPEMSLAKLATAGRYYRRKDFKRELADIAAEYRRRGIDPNAKPERKQVRKNAPCLQPLLVLEAAALAEYAHAMPVVRAVLAQDIPNVPRAGITSALPEGVSVAPVDGNGWRYLLNPDGCAGWRGVHAELGQTGLYGPRDAVERAIEWGHYEVYHAPGGIDDRSNDHYESGTKATGAGDHAGVGRDGAQGVGAALPGG